MSESALIPKIINNSEFGIDFRYWDSKKLGQRVYLGTEIVNYLGYNSGTKNLHRYELEEGIDMIKLVKKGNEDFFKQLHVSNTLGQRAGSVILITESGIFKLLLKSKKAFAKNMRDWICRTVLPSIKDTGKYIVGEEMIAPNQLTELGQYTFGVKQKEISKVTNYKISIGTGDYASENNNIHLIVHGRTAGQLRSKYHENGSAKDILRKHEPAIACTLALFENLSNNDIDRDKIIDSGVIKMSKEIYNGFEKLGIPLYIPVPKALK